MQESLFTVKGINGEVDLFEDRIRIRRKKSKGDKDILLTHISAIQYKRAGTFVPGYIRFAFSGSQEWRGDKFAIANDENSVKFLIGQAPAFDDLKARIESLIEQGPPPPPRAALTLADLEVLGRLREQGVVSAEEFEAKKKQILGL